MADLLGTGYSPELNDATYQALLRKLQQQGMLQSSAVSGAASARGLAGSSFEGAGLGQVQQGVTNASADALVNLSLQNAQNQREERLTKEAQTYQTSERKGGEAFTGGQNTQAQKAQQDLTKIQQDFQATQQQHQNDFADLERQKQEAFQAGETTKAQNIALKQQQLQQDFQQSQLKYQTENQNAQANLDRLQQISMQQNQQNFDSSQNNSKERSDLLNTGIAGIGSLGGNLISKLGSGIFGATKTGSTATATGGGLGTNNMFGSPSLGAASGGGSGLFAPAAGAIGGIGGGLFATNQLSGAGGSQQQGSARLGGQIGTGVGTAAGSLLGPVGGVIGGTIGGAAGSLIGNAVPSVSKAARKIFCFSPDTMIAMKDGTFKVIGDMRLGDETRGGEVLSIRISRSKDLYLYAGSVAVTGYHAVKENGVWLRIKDSKHSMKLCDESLVVSLVTSDHRIYSDDGIEFADEHETSLYEWLNIDESLAVLNNEEKLKQGKPLVMEVI